MRSDRPTPSESGRVILFRPRQARSGPARDTPPKWASPPSKSPVEGLRKYQQARDDEDYRHRMVVNVVGLAFCILLAIAGVWLVNEFAEMKRIQDCVLSGRSNCVPLKVPGQG